MKLKVNLILLFLLTKSTAASLQISFIAPNKQGDPFWSRVIDVTQSVAKDFDVDVTTYHSDTNRFASIASVESISQMKEKPDYVIYRPIEGSSITTFDILESKKIPFVTLEHGYSDNELAILGSPQQKYKYWIGAIRYDDEAAGALLTSALYKQHLKTHPDKTMYITGIGGGFERVSLARQASLEKIYWSTSNIVVNQIFPTAWELDTVKKNFPAIYSRYPNTTAFWCVADLYGVTVIEQLKLLGKTTNQKILVGGFDWLPEAIDLIKKREMTASVGGHFLMGGKALLYIFEYHNSDNIAQPKNSLENFELIDQENVDVYQRFLNKSPWLAIDFRKFSSVYNDKKKPIDLTVANLISAYSKLSPNIE